MHIAQGTFRNNQFSCDSDASINPLNADLNPICHLLAFLGAHHILHVSRIKVKYYCEDKSMLMSSEMFQASKLLASDWAQSDSYTCRHTVILITIV